MDYTEMAIGIQSESDKSAEGSMDFEGVIILLQSIKDFRVNDELPFNTVDYLVIDNAINFLAAQTPHSADGNKAVALQNERKPK